MNKSRISQHAARAWEGCTCSPNLPAYSSPNAKKKRKIRDLSREALGKISGSIVEEDQRPRGRRTASRGQKAGVCQHWDFHHGVEFGFTGMV